MAINWHGVFPAMTTPFSAELEIDFERVAAHCEWLVDAGAVGVIPAGSLGEGATLSQIEKVRLVATCVEAVGARAAVVPGVAALATADAVALAQAVEAAGASGLMVLPAYAYPGDRREASEHVGAVLSSTSLPCLLYNNPAAYGADFEPDWIAELVECHPNLVAVKESSTDVRRVTEIRRLLGERLDVLVGIDDVVVEGVAAGAVGWVAGLVNAFPEETIALFEHARAGRTDEVEQIYHWFLPLLRLDTDVKLVQLIKLAQELVGQGDWRVRPPRLALDAQERAETESIIRHALAHRPRLGAAIGS